MRLIPAVAVSSFAIHDTEMEGGTRGVDGDLSPSAGGTYSRWCDGPEEYQGYRGLNPGESQLFPG